MSSDGTAAFIDKHYSDTRIRLYLNTENLGFTANFEKAFNLCRGELICPCDQDDIWESSKLSILAEALGQHQLVYSDSEFIDSNSESLGFNFSDKFNMYSGSDPAAFVFRNCVSGHSMLVRSAVLKQAMPFPKYFFYDWWIAFVSTSIGSIQYVDKTLVKYRQHPAAVTSSDRSHNTRNRLLEARKTKEWLTLLKEFQPSQHRSYFNSLYLSWIKWEKQFLSFDLYCLLRQRYKTLYYIDYSERAALRRPLLYLFGLKTRRIIMKDWYRENSP
jgi:glycosyltransferase involved in cell wall biosynthesis